LFGVELIMSEMTIEFTHPVPDKLLCQIGDITASFSVLERSIQDLAWCLISRNLRVGQIVTAELSLKNLRVLVINLYKGIYGQNDELKKLCDLMKKSSMLEEKRNQIIHSEWSIGRTINEVKRIKRTAKQKSGLNFQIENLTESDLKNIAKDLRVLATKIHLFSGTTIKINLYRKS